MSALEEFQLEVTLLHVKQNHVRVMQLEAELTTLRRVNGVFIKSALDLAKIVHPGCVGELQTALFEDMGIDIDDRELARYETARRGGEINWLLDDPEEIEEPVESAPARRNGNGKRKALGKTLGEINESTQRKADRKRK